MMHVKTLSENYSNNGILLNSNRMLINYTFQFFQRDLPEYLMENLNIFILIGEALDEGVF